MPPPFPFFLAATGRPDIKGKRKADAEPDADHEQRQKNVGAPEDSKRLKIDGAQGIRHIPCL